MGRSFHRPAIETGSYFHKPSDRYYELVTRDGKLFQTRHQIGFNRKETNFEEKQIDYVVGSGNHARTYLHRNPDGRFIELPVSWYAEKGGYFAMSPGYDNARPEDFRRTVPDDCLFCHNGYPKAGVIAEGIDCQRCHGPGRAHVESSGKAAIVNPAKLDRDRQLDDCMQCHLETTSLRLPNAIRRYDRTPFSYRPGEPLTDYEIFFDHAPGTDFDDRFEVAHQAYRLRKSACFLQSKMTCTTCHDPHQAQTAEHFVSVCKSCHAMPHSNGDCLDCHMWKRRSEDAVHVVMTDHFIQRRKPARDFLAALPETALPYQGEVVPYYPSRTDELYLAVAQVQHESNLQVGLPRLVEAIAKTKPEIPEFYVELGKAWSKSGKQDEAIRAYEEALRHRENYPPALRELAAALALNGNISRAIEVGGKASADTAALTNLGNAYLQQGNVDRAKEVLEQALALNPELPDAANLLGLVSLAKQDQEKAEAAFRRAIAIQPEMAEAHNNLGNLLAARKDYAEAAYHFQQAIASNPSYADVHHSYGLLLVLTHSYDQAAMELGEAARLNPNSAQLHIDFADALAGRGRIPAALDEYRRALQVAGERTPEYYEAHLSLGAIMAKNGNRTEARSHLQLASQSSDPDIRQTALKELR
jgi:tetratricopeptide (TPR) repeat protein